MARKLPWAQTDQAPKPERRRQKTPEARLTKASEPDSTGRDKDPKAVVKRRHRSRSRSTSPPPGPPSVEPMREGFEEDDIWIIVEDEFEALAKTFTAHLHHAEYKKLVKKARDAPPKSLPTATSPMSKETIRRLQRDSLRHKQEEAVEGIGAGSASRPTEDNVEDPWRGTSIAGLIATGSQEKRSLRGIDRLPSSTRAAQGFARPGSRDGEQLDLELPHHTERLGRAEATDLEGAPDVTRSGAVTNSAQARQAETLHASRRPESARSKTDARGHPPETTSKDAMPASKRPLGSSLLAKRKKVRHEDSREERLSQVPMFLI